jgi:hypothetical protein
LRTEKDGEGAAGKLAKLLHLPHKAGRGRVELRTEKDGEGAAGKLAKLLHLPHKAGRGRGRRAGVVGSENGE